MNEPLRQRGARLTDGAKGPQRVVVMCDGRAEDRDELLGQELLNLAFVSVDDDRDLRQGGSRLLAGAGVLQVDGPSSATALRRRPCGASSVGGVRLRAGSWAMIIRSSALSSSDGASPNSSTSSSRAS